MPRRVAARLPLSAARNPAYRLEVAGSEAAWIADHRLKHIECEFSTDDVHSGEPKGTSSGFFFPRIRRTMRTVEVSTIIWSYRG